jgi:hypothetical protein
MANKGIDLTELLLYRDSVKNEPETDFQKIALGVIDKAIENLRAQQ